MVVEPANLFARAARSLGACGISGDLLLLSRCILQSVLGRSAGVHCGRAAQELLGRTILPVDHAECASIFSLSRGVFSHRTLHRRLEGAVVFKWIWNRRRHNCAGNQCCFARRLYVWLSLATAFGRRISRSIFQITNVLPRLRVRDLFQSPPHALGVAESLLGRLCRSLRASVRNGYLA